MDANETRNFKPVLISQNVHRELKTLATKEGRRLSGDLTNDIVMLGIQEFKRAKKI